MTRDVFVPFSSATEAKHLETFYRGLDISSRGSRKRCWGGPRDAITKHFRLSRGALREKGFPTRLEEDDGWSYRDGVA